MITITYSYFAICQTIIIITWNYTPIELTNMLFKWLCWLLLLLLLLLFALFSDDDMMSIASMMSVSNLSTIGYLEDDEDDDYNYMYVRIHVVSSWDCLCSDVFLCVNLSQVIVKV